jgi:acetolactate synthase-1/2/3 large subunit
LIGDTDLVLQKILDVLGKKAPSKKFVVPQELIQLKQQRTYFADVKMLNNDMPLKPQRFLKLLRDALPHDTIVFGDIGNSLPWLESNFQTLMPNTFFICSSLASMGYGVSAAIGGQIAADDQQVVCICGDGDFQMQGMEVITAVNYNIPVIWYILNNQSLAMISDLQNLMFGGRIIATTFTNPDFVKLAEAMGAVGIRITKPEEVEPVTSEALRNKKPTVIDVMIDPDEIPSFDARAEAITRAWGTSAPLLKKLKMIPELLKRR